MLLLLLRWGVSWVVLVNSFDARRKALHHCGRNSRAFKLR